MKNNLKKIMKKLDLEFPGVTDESIKYLIKQIEYKKQKKRDFVEYKLPSILIMLIGCPCILFISLFFTYIFKIQLDIVKVISIIILSVCIPLAPAKLMWID